MTIQMETPWAVLLCKFSDNNSEPFPRGFYDNLFTSAGVGMNNMVDYFRLYSHGNIDIGGSQVFGWLTLSQKRADYTGSGVNTAGRLALIDWARQAASAAQVDLSPYSGVVVCMNVPTDLFGDLGAMAMVCDNNSMDPSQVAQEMLHGYGLNHSRSDDPNFNLLGCLSPPPDYRDPWDVMSTACAFMAVDLNFGKIGPGLNAALMDHLGWLDPSRVWSQGGFFDATVQLRPHHRRDLPGFLAAKVGGFYVEFRMNEGWDAFIPGPAVLVHRFHDDHSYLMKGAGGGQQLVDQSNPFQFVDQSLPGWPQTLVEVTSIDAANHQVTIHISYTARTLTVTVDPYPLPLGKQVSLTVHAVDAHTGTPVDGQVVIHAITKDGKWRKLPPFHTDTPHFFTLYLSDPALNPPTGTVSAPTYLDAHIDFGW